MGCWCSAYPSLPLALLGASVINTRCSETYETKTALLSLFGIPLWYQSQSPRVILQVSTRVSLRGFSGVLVGRKPTAIMG